MRGLGIVLLGLQQYAMLMIRYVSRYLLSVRFVSQFFDYLLKDEINESLVRSHGIQCGFCTPGMVMTLFCLLRNKPNLTQYDVEEALEGEFGKEPWDTVWILYTRYGDDTVLSPEEQAESYSDCPLGEKCCQNKSNDKEQQTDLKNSEFSPNHVTQNVIFPPELTRSSDKTMKIFKHSEWTWILPFALSDLLDAKAKFPDSKIVMGATGISYFLHTGKLGTYTLIDGTKVSDLQNICVKDNCLEIGSAVTMATLEQFLKEVEDPKPSAVMAMLSCLRWIAAGQIRNAATIGGHIMTADSRSDLNPLLITLRASIVVQTNGGKEKEYPLFKNFFTGRFKTCLSSEDVLIKVKIPEFKKTNCHIGFYKQAERKGFDYAIANAACMIRLSEHTVDGATICVGGISDRPVMLEKTEEAIKGKKTDALSLDVQEILKPATQEVSVLCKDKYKQSLVNGFLIKFLESITKDKKEASDPHEPTHWLAPCSSTQVFEDAPTSQSDIDPLRRPLPQVTSHNLVSGQAPFVGDMPRFKDELYLSPVCSLKAHAKIVSVDTSEALKEAGVIGYYNHTDVIGQNWFGLIMKDEELFASEEVHCYGQMIGVIAATSEAVAVRAARLVKVTYEELTPILTIEDAIKENSYHPYSAAPIEKGEVDPAFSKVEIVEVGEVSTGSQEHFYLEPLSTVAIPKMEDGEMEIFLSHQSPSFLQQSVATLLNIPRSRVIVRQRRAGGAFGGKQMPPFKVAGPAALVAQITGRPVRFVLDRHLDMIMTGKRHPYLMKYKVGFDKEGNISVADFDIYSNAGYSTDISPAVMTKSLMTIDGCYSIPNMRVKGHLCKTNTPTNTAFRGLGAPQAVVGTETMIYHVAKTVGKLQEEIRQKHLYKENDITLCKMVMENCNVQKCWEACKKQCQFERLQCEVTKFNSENQYRKRGLAMVPVKFPLGFNPLFLNQGLALINVYLDGSVKLTHGGCEIGQGLNTNMIQVASSCLGIPVTKIYTGDNSTDVIANATVTGASSTSDIIAVAVTNGCKELLERLKPFREENPDISWEELVVKAYFNRVNLSVLGYSITEGGSWNSETATGHPCNYYTYGAGCCVAEIDCLTGDHQILSMDIVMDVGKSLNPAIDIGQIEGGFIQGYGMMTLENMKWTPEGVQISNGPINYKIPGVRNIPREFRVSLLKDSPNPKTLYSSKGVGEPPLLLSVAVYLALKEAISSARKSGGNSENFRLDCPVTAERIGMACPH
ncbi:hypothetical protein FSP39_013013 [Pinctada imbricata]|uniref:FAD-binding PCMH-type domain-containing protein n=1 Tax=Pinctada imbricata TaxID=66713 RepID=A0AA88XSS9_PINIB|nr:hypothetical protein FSP39_013013 [Pinctada imbricata]